MMWPKSKKPLVVRVLKHSPESLFLALKLLYILQMLSKSQLIQRNIAENANSSADKKKIPKHIHKCLEMHLFLMPQLRQTPEIGNG